MITKQLQQHACMHSYRSCRLAELIAVPLGGDWHVPSGDAAGSEMMQQQHVSRCGIQTAATNTIHAYMQACQPGPLLGQQQQQQQQFALSAQRRLSPIFTPALTTTLQLFATFKMPPPPTSPVPVPQARTYSCTHWLQ